MSTDWKKGKPPAPGVYRIQRDWLASPTLDTVAYAQYDGKKWLCGAVYLPKLLSDLNERKVSEIQDRQWNDLTQEEFFVYMQHAGI